MLAKLDHCVIHISDWERSNAFYRDVVGAELIDRGGGTWAYRFGTEQLNEHGPGARPDPVALIPVAPGNSDLCFENGQGRSTTPQRTFASMTSQSSRDRWHETAPEVRA